MTSNVTIRPLRNIPDLTAMQAVEEAVWQMPAIPVHQTFTTVNNGGIILGAFDGSEMVAFLYSFPGFDGKKSYLSSHMLGILPSYRKQGLGMQMKLEQARLAKKKGYAVITWTFDPLESLNAYLNLHKLGAVGAFYKPDHYGTMDDSINEGLPTDRFHVEWNIQQNRPGKNHSFDASKLLLKNNSHGEPDQTAAFKKGRHNQNAHWYVAIPGNFQTIKQENFPLASKWRQETRTVFEALFSEGFHATDLVRDPANPNCYYYCFTQKQPLQEDSH